MKNTLLAILLGLFFTLPAYGQTDELTSLLEDIATLVPEEVLVGKDNYRQEFSFDAANPYRITLTKIKEGSKGDVTEKAEINLGLVKTVRDNPDKKGIFVEFSTGNNGSIKISEDDEVKGYDDEFFIYGEDAANGEAIAEKLKLALPLAKTAWEAAAALPEAATDIQAYVQERIKDVANSDGDKYEQELSFGSLLGDATLVTGGAASKDGDVEFTLQVGDLNPRKLEVAAKGSIVLLTMETKKRSKYVAAKEEDVSFQDDLTLYFENYDDALVVAYALEKLIEPADEAYEASLADFQEVSAAQSALIELLDENSAADYEFTLAEGCLTTLDSREGEDDEQRFEFDYADLDAKKIEINPKGGVVLVGFATEKGRKYVGLTSGDERKNYDDEVTVAFAGVDAAKRAAHALEYLARNCSDETTPPDEEAVLELLSAEYQDGEIEQEVSVAGCKMTVMVKEDGKKNQTLESEFELEDLDAEDGKIVVKGTSVTLVFPTKDREEVIQQLENEEEQTYTDEIIFLTPDLQTAKTLLSGINAMIGRCGGED